MLDLSVALLILEVFCLIRSRINAEIAKAHNVVVPIWLPFTRHFPHYSSQNRYSIAISVSFTFFTCITTEQLYSYL